MRSVALLLFAATVASAQGSKPDPKRAAAKHVQLGLDAERLGDTDKALAEFEKALTYEAKHPEALRGRAQALWVKGDREASLAAWTTAIGVSPEVPTHYLSRAEVREALGDYPAAIADCDAAIERDQAKREAFERRAGLHIYLGHWKEAAADLRRQNLLTPAGIIAEDALFARLWVASARAGEETKEAAAHFEGKEPDRSNLPLCAGLYLAGKLSESDYLALADSKTPKLKAVRECSVRWHIAQRRLAEKDEKGAREQLEKCVAVGLDWQFEWRAAKAELALLTEKR